MNNYRLAVDIGGTFTDGVLQAGDRLWSAKIPTTPEAPEKAFLTIAAKLLSDADATPDNLFGIIHGATIATNSLIERKGARTALVTTQGFRDSLEIGYESRYDQYDLGLNKLAPLVPRQWRYVIKERVLANGKVLEPLKIDEISEIARQLKQDQVESVAIGFLHSPANPIHERQFAEHLTAILPDLPISLSSDICPEIREYERLSTTVANAYIKPVMAGYLTTLQHELARQGFRCPLFLVTSAGGLMEPVCAIERPVNLVESGPSGGATLAEITAERLDARHLLSFDMGGTSAKICLIDHAWARTTREFEAARSERFIKGSGMPLRIPVTEMIEIGAGGGSICSADDLGRLQVGPRSAGARPGPACYGNNGYQPTVTDANLIAGRLDADRFAEGRLPLDQQAADNALTSLSTTRAADNDDITRGILEIVDENMANAARIHAMEHASDLRDYQMVAFGGGGPLHATNVARKLGIETVIIPPMPGVGSALGFLGMPASVELSRSRYMTLGNFDAAGASEIISGLVSEAKQIVSRAMPGEQQFVQSTALMRYTGQGHNIEVTLPDDLDNASEKLRQRYAETYRQQYGRELPGGEIEIMTFTVRVSTQRPAVVMQNPDRLSSIQSNNDDMSARYVLDMDSGERCKTAVYLRSHLIAERNYKGPALVMESQTTTVVPDRASFHVDAVGNLLVKLHTAESARQHNEDDITYQSAWRRMQSIVDEQAAVLMRTAFSPIVRESGDLSVGIFDLDGRMLTQAVTGTPGHVNTMASACEKFFPAIPRETMRDGDIYLTNDPWAGAGHLNDLVLLKPCFHQQELVGFVSCTSHLVDIGGRCLGPDGNDVFDEGLYIPHMHLVRGGEVDQTLLKLLSANSRSPLQAEGDLFALIACCEHGQLRLSQMFEDFGLANFDGTGNRIIDSSQHAVANRIAALDDGAYDYSMTVDGYESPITLTASLTIKQDRMALSFTQSAGLSQHGINVPINYTIAYTVFGLKCAVAPEVPNNHGSLSGFIVSAEPGTILNATKPAPVCSRHILGQLLPDVALGCLAEVLPDQVPAEGAATLWDLPMQGVILDSGETFAQELVFNGGTGARPFADGLSATAFPSGVMGSLVEITETTTPILVRRRELRPDSGGEGRYRGGHGQIIEIEALEGTSLTVYGTVDRVQYPARGRAGGKSGSPGKFVHSAGTSFSGKGKCTLSAGQSLQVSTPGGGGYGSPTERDQSAVDTDKQNQLLNRER